MPVSFTTTAKGVAMIPKALIQEAHGKTRSVAIAIPEPSISSRRLSLNRRADCGS